VPRPRRQHRRGGPMTATRPGAIKEIFAAARGPAWTFSFYNGFPR
jgi:hypothetical protein